MEKLWNLSKMAVPMEKLWNFRLGRKKVRAFFKKMGEKYVRTSMFVALGYHFTRPSSTNLPGYSASLSRVNTCWAVNIVRPLSRVRQQVLMSY